MSKKFIDSEKILVIARWCALKQAFCLLVSSLICHQLCLDLFIFKKERICEEDCFVTLMHSLASLNRKKSEFLSFQLKLRCFEPHGLCFNAKNVGIRTAWVIIDCSIVFSY